jgi:hypothetical protein
MDRAIVYPGSIPLDTDLLATNRNTMIALGALAQATLGTSPAIDGLAVSPTTPASLSIVCGPGSITQFTTVDQNAFGSLSADTADGLLKMGVNLSSSTIAFAAPTTSGQAIAYLIEATFQESDASPVVLPYYNAANPASPYLGPNNTGAAQSTQRTQRVQLQVKASTPATIGTQVTPSVDAGWSSLASITVAYGQTQITATSITQMPTSPTLQFKLPSLRPGFAQLQSFTSSGSFTLPIGVTRARITVIGGGGAGGTHSNLPGGGGGGGATGIRILSGLAPGAVVAVTVGAAGVAPTGGATGPGGNGGTSSFGAYVSATGGLGGGGGSSSTTTAGGGGGTAVGGDLNFAGSCGTDSIILAARGGDGGGPGSGRGTTGYIQGLTAQGYGGGGGGGGASNTTGTGSGAPGGNGGAGLVIVEY